MSQIRLPITAILLVCLATALDAQQAAPSTSLVQHTRQFETRADIQAQAAAAERQGRSSEAWLLRSRLERGDFHEGDRIVVILEGATLTVDTLQVRSGKVIQFPRLGDLSLAGILRSELTDTVRSYLSRYLTTPVVRTTPLLPIAIVGRVASPGFYYSPADAVLRDVIMLAGGPQAEANLGKVVIRRGGDVIWKSDDVRIALADGLSLDALHLRSGDEVYVPQRRAWETQTIVALVTSGVAILATVVNLTRN